jgi:hypothetical protein
MRSAVARGFLIGSASRPFIVNVASEAVNRLFDLPDLPQNAAPRLATAWPEGFLFEDAAMYQACMHDGRNVLN